MSFDVELSFTGLGVLLLRSGSTRDPHPQGVELLLLRTSSHAGHGGPGEPHLPRLSFQIDDLITPENRILSNLQPGPDAIPIVELDVTDTNFSITVTGGDQNEFDVEWNSDPDAVEPGTGATPDAVDWIPDLDQQFGLNPIVLPEDPNGKMAYTTRVTLPPGRITSRHFLLDPNLTPARWTFGGIGSGRVLAERLVWSCTNVDSFSIDLLGGTALDAAIRAIHNQPALVSLALTNLPQSGVSGRFRDPTHFEQFQNIAVDSNAVVRQIQRVPPLPQGITTGGTCPPGRKEI